MEGTIQEIALREVQEDARRRAIENAKHYILAIAQKQEELLETQSKIVELQKKLAAITVPEFRA